MAERPFSIPGSNSSTGWIRSMVRAAALPREWDRGVLWVVGIALGTVVLHVATGWRYGFDRDELMAIEDARHLAWGFVPYPPMLPFFARVALALFGTSLVGFRVFAALAQAAALVLTGLMAKEVSDQRPMTSGREEKWRVASGPSDKTLRTSEWRAKNQIQDPLSKTEGGAPGEKTDRENRNSRIEKRAEVSEQRSATGDQETTSGHNYPAETGLAGLKTGRYEEWAGVMAALAGVPFCLGGGALMQYISFDYLCWVLVAYCMVRLLKSDDARWWIGVGAAIGLGFMAKYTMAFFAVGVIAGVLLTPARRFLRSGWLWAGVGTAAAIAAPNLWWQWKHQFVSLEFLRFIHARDVRVGLTDWFLPGQLELTMLAFPLVVAGLWFLLFTESGEKYRPLAWMYLVPLALFVVMRGRAYYIAPAYPMLYAAGAVWLENRKWKMENKAKVASDEWQVARKAKTTRGDLSVRQENGKAKIESREEGRDQRSAIGDQEHQEGLVEGRKLRKQGESSHSRLRSCGHGAQESCAPTRRWAKTLTYALWVGLIVDVGVAAAVALPIAPVNSGWWNFATKVDPIFPEEIGWPEFVETVAGVRDRLPVGKRNSLKILAGNYGELGALNLYGGRYGLPAAIGGENSSWERGYGEDPDTVIVTGYSREFLEQHFASCEVGANVWNKYGVVNEEILEDSRIFVCRGLKEGWPEFWAKIRKFG